MIAKKCKLHYLFDFFHLIQYHTFIIYFEVQSK